MKLLCLLLGHDPVPLVPLHIGIQGGEGHRPYYCRRCLRRIFEQCDAWHIQR